MGDRQQHVAGCVATGGARRREIDRDGCAGRGVVDGVEIAAALQRIAAHATGQRIGPAPAVQQIVVVVARQHVGPCRAAEVPHADEHVALGLAAEACPGAQVDGDRLPRRVVVGRVDSASTRQRVTAAAADQRVGAIPAVDLVCIAVTRQQVGLARADDVADAGQDVALGVSAGPRSGRDIDGDARVRGDVAHRIDATAALQRVGTHTADQRVVAGSAIEDVVVAVTRQQVGIRRAGDVLDVGIGVAGRFAACGRPGQQVDGHGSA